jgi:hypothetical protein
LAEKCEYYQQQYPPAPDPDLNPDLDLEPHHSVHSVKVHEPTSPCHISPSVDFPPYTTTYTSGSFIVSRENILALPLKFYQRLYQRLYEGERWVDTTCGSLEYVWTTIWGGTPWEVQPYEGEVVGGWCGPLYHADISSNSGFMFFQSDDGSVEEGYLPERYHGVIYNRDTGVISSGRYVYTEGEGEEELVREEGQEVGQWDEEGLWNAEGEWIGKPPEEVQ